MTLFALSLCLFAVSADAGRVKKATDDLGSSASAAVTPGNVAEPAAPGPRLKRAAAQAEEGDAQAQPQADAPAAAPKEPESGYGRRLKPMRKSLLKPLPRPGETPKQPAP